jgi:hypothetical protein
VIGLLLVVSPGGVHRIISFLLSKARGVTMVSGGRIEGTQQILASAMMKKGKSIKLFFDDLKYGSFSFLGPIYALAPLGYRLLHGLCSAALTW